MGEGDGSAGFRWHGLCDLKRVMKVNKPSKKLIGNPKLSGKVGWLLLWLVGIPVPILLVLFLLRGCT